MSAWPRGHQLGRVVGVGRCHQLDLETLGGEEALLARDDQRRVVRIDEPVEQDGQPVRGQGGTACQDEAEKRGAAGGGRAS